MIDGEDDACVDDEAFDLEEFFLFQSENSQAIQHDVRALADEIQAAATSLRNCGCDVNGLLRRLLRIDGCSDAPMLVLRKAIAHKGDDAIAEMESKAREEAERFLSEPLVPLDVNNHPATPAPKAKTKRKRRRRRRRGDDDEEMEDEEPPREGDDDNARGAVARDEEARDDESEGANDDGAEETDVVRFAEDDYEAIAADYERSNNSLVVATIPLNLNIPLHIDDIFDPQDPNLESLLALAQHYTRLLSVNGNYGDLQARYLRLRAQDIQNDALPAPRGSDTWGSYLTALPDDDEDDEDGNENDEAEGGNDAAEQLAQLREQLRELKREIYKLDHPEAGADSTEEVNGDRLQKFLEMGLHSRRIARHLFHASFQRECYRIQTVVSIFSGLADKAKSRMMIDRARATARPFGLELDDTTTADEYIRIVILPGMDSDVHCESVIVVACDLYKHTTETSGKVRKQEACDVTRKVEVKRFDGRVDESVARWCSDINSTNHTKRRKKSCTTFWVLAMMRAIKRLRPDLFPFGYTASILLLSPTDIQTMLPFMLKASFYEEGALAKKDAAKLKTAVDKMESQVKRQQDAKTGLRTVVVDSEEQLNSLSMLAL